MANNAATADIVGAYSLATAGLSQAEIDAHRKSAILEVTGEVPRTIPELRQILGNGNSAEVIRLVNELVTAGTLTRNVAANGISNDNTDTFTAS